MPYQSFYMPIFPRSHKGSRTDHPLLEIFGLKSERLDRLPKTLAQLFLDYEYMI